MINISPFLYLSLYETFSFSFLKTHARRINYKQKKIDGNPELCFFNIRLKPFEGKTEQPALKDSSKNDNDTGINNYDNYEVPPDENPFE